MANSGLRFHESPLFFCLYPGECDKKMSIVWGVNARESVKMHKSTSLIFAIMWIDVEVCMHYN